MTNPVPRLARLTTAALPLLAACSGSTTFEIREVFEVDSTAGISDTREVDLADLAGEAWDHRNRIDAVTVHSATASILAVGAQNEAPNASAEGVLLRGTGENLESARIVDALVPVEVGRSTSGTNLREASRILERALDSDGLVAVELDAAPASGRLQATVEVVVEVEVEWTPF